MEDAAGIVVDHRTPSVGFGAAGAFGARTGRDFKPPPLALAPRASNLHANRSCWDMEEMWVALSGEMSET